MRFSSSLNVCVAKGAPSSPLQYYLSGSPRSTGVYIRVGWRIPADDGGSPILDFKVRWRKEGSTASWSTATAPFGDVETGHKFRRSPRWNFVSGLVAGDAQYRVEVAARNASGVGAYASGTVGVCYGTEQTYSSSAGKCLGKPSEPAGASLGVGDGSLTVTWIEPVSDGGSPVQDYSVEWGRSFSSRYTSTAVSTASFSYVTAGTKRLKQWSKTITNLTNGVRYAIRVAASNSKGKGDYAYVYESPCPAGQRYSYTGRGCAAPPPAPVNVSVEPGEGSLVLHWWQPTSAGAVTWSNFIVKWRQGTMGEWKEKEFWTSTVKSPLTIGSASVYKWRYELSPLSSGVLYQVSIAARNPAGKSAASSTTGTPCAVGRAYSKVRLMCIAPPAAPGGFVAAAVSENTMSAEWFQATPPASSLVSGYELRWRRQGGAGDWSTAGVAWARGVDKALAAPPGTSVREFTHTVSGLTANTAYEFQVRPFNERHLGEYLPAAAYVAKTCAVGQRLVGSFGGCRASPMASADSPGTPSSPSTSDLDVGPGPGDGELAVSWSVAGSYPPRYRIEWKKSADDWAAASSMEVLASHVLSIRVLPTALRSRTLALVAIAQSSLSYDYLITGLQTCPSIQYDVRVTGLAVVAATGGVSAKAQAFTPITRTAVVAKGSPSVPRNIRVFGGSVKGDQLYVYWEKPTCNGGSTLESYTVGYSTDSSTWDEKTVTGATNVARNH